MTNKSCLDLDIIISIVEKLPLQQVYDMRCISSLFNEACSIVLRRIVRRTKLIKLVTFWKRNGNLEDTPKLLRISNDSSNAYSFIQNCFFHYGREWGRSYDQNHRSLICGSILGKTFKHTEDVQQLITQFIKGWEDSVYLLSMLEQVKYTDQLSSYIAEKLSASLSMAIHACMSGYFVSLLNDWEIISDMAEFIKKTKRRVLSLDCYRALQTAAQYSGADVDMSEDRIHSIVKALELSDDTKQKKLLIPYVVPITPARATIVHDRVSDQIAKIKAKHSIALFDGNGDDIGVTSLSTAKIIKDVLLNHAIKYVIANFEFPDIINWKIVRTLNIDDDKWVYESILSQKAIDDHSRAVRILRFCQENFGVDFRKRSYVIVDNFNKSDSEICGRLMLHHYNILPHGNDFDTTNGPRFGLWKQVHKCVCVCDGDAKSTLLKWLPDVYHSLIHDAVCNIHPP